MTLDTPTTNAATISPPADPPSPRAGLGRVGLLIAGVCVATCVVWALRPLKTASLEVPDLAGEAEAQPAAQPLALDLAAFNAPLWVAPPPPPKAAQAPAPAPPLPPLKWQLLAIAREGEVYKALVYDPDLDTLLVLGAGDQAGVRRVTSVSASSMEVRDGAGLRTLLLRDQAGARP